MVSRTPLILSLIVGASAAVTLLAPSTQAGPLVRRMQERQACQEFASKLEAASGNPQQAQMVYQQGVLKLVATFGENPCGDIPAPVATPAPAAAPAAKPAPAAAASNPQQAQACQEFASKLKAAQGNPSQAQQIYAMGTQKLSGMFGPNPCPSVPQP